MKYTRNVYVRVETIIRARIRCYVYSTYVRIRTY